MSRGSWVNALPVWPSSRTSALCGVSPLTSRSLVQKKIMMSWIHTALRDAFSSVDTFMWNPKCCFALNMSHRLQLVKSVMGRCIIADVFVSQLSTKCHIYISSLLDLGQTHDTLFLPNNSFGFRFYWGERRKWSTDRKVLYFPQPQDKMM